MTNFVRRLAGPAAVLLAGFWLAVPPASAASLFDDLGGREGITAIVDGGIERVLADPRIKVRFGNTDAKRLKAQLVEQFCQISGGPCVYQGQPMEKAHADMNIRDAEFNALAEDFQAAMDQRNVPFTVQNRLLGLLAPMQRTVVGQ